MSLTGAAIVPHPPILVEEVGGKDRLQAQHTLKSMETMAKDVRMKNPDTLLMITPHGTLFKDAVSILYGSELKGDFLDFGAVDLGFSFKNNRKLAKEIEKSCEKESIPVVLLDEEKSAFYRASPKLDHGACVPLYFICKEIQDFQLVHMTYGLLSSQELYAFGKVVEKVVSSSLEKVYAIASGDLSHCLKEEGPYRYHPMGKVFDEKIVELIEKGDFQKIKNFDLSMSEAACECGLRSFQILGGILHKSFLKPKILSYEGPWGVGYLCALIELEDKYVSLAKEAVNLWITKKEKLEPGKEYEKILQEKASCFVTYHLQGELRGCIGTLEPYRESLAHEIVSNAISAAVEDDRFYPITKEELEHLQISVDVLKEPKRILSDKELDPKKYGVIVEKGRRRGVLLPNIEGVDTAKEQIFIAKRKAWIAPEEEVTLYRFEVERHE